MNEWLAKARAARISSALSVSEPCANCAVCAKTSADAEANGSFGTNGTIGTGFQIPPEEIASRFSWIRQRLTKEHGRDPERAGSDALAVLRADLLNDVRLMPLQVDTTRCLVCGDVGRPSRPLVPVLAARPDDRLWLHLEPCHAEYLRRQRVKIGQILDAVMTMRDDGRRAADVSNRKEQSR
jgi:hypothetical protein